MRTLAATHPQQLFWLLLSSQCHCRWPGEMTTLLALELALCCSNVTYRQPGDIYGNAVACESIPKLAALLALLLDEPLLSVWQSMKPHLSLRLLPVHFLLSCPLLLSAGDSRGTRHLTPDCIIILAQYNQHVYYRQQHRKISP